MDIHERVSGLDWAALEASLWEHGYAHTPAVLSAEQCASLARLFEDDSRFRSRVDMERHRFGRGEYKYFGAPLPSLVRQLREAFYPGLAAIANRWSEALGAADRYPDALDAFLERCAAEGQTRPTPLLLRYEAGGYNCLHQDLYGAVAFPMQVVVSLDEPGEDFSGGEFLLVEQRPRAQSAGTVVLPRRGEAVVFTTRARPVRGSRGVYRVQVRHGVSRVRSGRRHTLGIIFHDAA